MPQRKNAHQGFLRLAITVAGTVWFWGCAPQPAPDSTESHDLSITPQLGYRQAQTAISMAHAAGVKIIGIPILPFRHSTKDVGTNWATAQAVNAWIRTPGNGYDAILDFEPVIGDPNDAGSLLSSMTCDHVHPNQAGYTPMANSIDLSIFR